MKYIFLLIFGLFTQFFIAQNAKEYAKQVVEILASEPYAGRGYTNEGLQKAEKEITSQFEKIGLKNFNNSYLQPVSYPINIIEDCSLKINGKELHFGTEYIVSGSAKTGSGKINAQYFNTSVIDSAFVNQSLEDLHLEVERLSSEAVVFPTAEFPLHLVSEGYLANDLYRELKMNFFSQDIGNNTVFIEMVPDKLTMGLSSKQENYYAFVINDSIVNEKINTIEYDVKSNFNPGFQTNNIVGYIPGKNPSKKILITAHFDHLGQVGSSYFPGANDNASGIALLLSLARYYSINQPNYTMVFIAFTGEEAGLQGSKAFVKNPPFDLKDIKLVCNFDIVGTGNKGIQIVNSVEEKEVYQQLVSLNQKHHLLPEIKKRGQACISDHCPFAEAGIPNIYTYTLGGAPYYHDIYDTSNNLTLAKFNQLFDLYTLFFNQY